MEELGQCSIRTTVRQRQPAIGASRGVKGVARRKIMLRPQWSSTGARVRQVDDQAW